MIRMMKPRFLLKFIYGHECSPEPAVDWGGAWCLGVRHLLGSCSPGPADSADLSGSSREPGCLSLDDGDGEGDEGLCG